MATLPRAEYDATPLVTPESTHQKLAELVRLQKSAQRITATLDLNEVIDRIVEEVAEALGCVEINLYLYHPEQNELELAGTCGCSLHGKGERVRVGTDGMVGYVAATRQLRYAPDVSVDPYYKPCEPDVRSEVAIPLQVDGNFVGVFSASHHDLDAFCPEQIRLMQGFCGHIAVALQNACRFADEQHLRAAMNREAEEARAIQEALLPRSSPLIPGFRVTGLSVPAGAVGGDWYDFIPLPNGRWGLVLADVSGKGTAAALLMSATRGMLRSLAQMGSGPGEVLTKLNQMLIDDFPSGRFVTMVYGELDPATHTFRLANAGHLPALLTGPSGHRWINTDDGLPLGITVGHFSEISVPMEKGSQIVLYSDGITEAALDSGEEYGRERLRTHVSTPNARPEGLINDVRRFVNGSGLRDDATAVIATRQ